MGLSSIPGITMSPKPSTENGYGLDEIEESDAGNKNLTGASTLVATVIIISVPKTKYTSYTNKPHKSAHATAKFLTFTILIARRAVAV